jgi:SPP1 family predicted phage head-tail adaptor
MKASDLDRRVQFRRYTSTPDGFGGEDRTWADHGAPVWAHRVDVSDSERFAAAQIQATVTTRFTVRSSEFTRDIDPKDRLHHAGLVFEITGTKESKHGRFQFIEITCSARTDQG